MLALSAAQAIPGNLRWLSASARVGAVQTGHVFASALLDHYRQTLNDIHATGYLAYARRQVTPYVRASIGQFAPSRRTFTDRIVETVRRGRKRK